MRKIESFEDPALGPYRTLRGSRCWKSDELSLEEHDTVFVVESEKVVRALLMSDVEVVSLLALPGYFESFKDLIGRKGIPDNAQYVVEKEFLDEVVGFSLHQGVLAVAKRPGSCPVEALRAPMVAMNGLTNPENVGAVIRNAAAFYVNDIIVDGGTVHPFLRRPARVSMGTVFSMNVHISSSLVRALEALKARGITVVGAHVTGRTTPLMDYRFPKDFCLVVGTEGTGLTPDVVAACDVLVKIPISSAVDSLNVAAATAIMLYNGQATNRCSILAI